MLGTTSTSSDLALILNYRDGLDTERRVRVYGTPDDPQFNAQDLCDLFDIVSAANVLRDFDDDEKGMYTIHTLGGRQRVITVYESGLYRLIFRSRKPEAKRFQKWVCKEVLPSIRQYGIYPPPQQSAYQLTLKPYTSRVVWMFGVRRALPRGYWCIFLEAAEILINAELIFGHAKLEMRMYDLIDGSIGQHWSDFRQDKPWMGLRRPYDYTFPPGDPRGTIRPWSYPMQELEHFKRWLHEDYMVQHFPAYIRRKYGLVEYQRALPLFAQMGIPMISAPGRRK